MFSRKLIHSLLLWGRLILEILWHFKDNVTKLIYFFTPISCVGHSSCHSPIHDSLGSLCTRRKKNPSLAIRYLSHNFQHPQPPSALSGKLKLSKNHTILWEQNKLPFSDRVPDTRVCRQRCGFSLLHSWTMRRGLLKKGHVRNNKIVETNARVL